jgi:hypothetical protein
MMTDAAFSPQDLLCSAFRARWQERALKRSYYCHYRAYSQAYRTITKI